MSWCIFCNTQINKSNHSNEDIIPQWLQKHLNIGKMEITPTHLSAFNYMKSERKHSLKNLLAGQICQSCNNGWMSKLENQIKNVLIQLIDGKKKIEELELNDQISIGRWALKTALTLNSGSNYHHNIPQMHYHFLINNKNSIPDGVFIFANQMNFEQKFYWIQSPSWIVNYQNILQDDLDVLNNESYKITLQFGKLLLLICYMPMINLVPMIVNNLHIPILPSKFNYPKKERVQEENTDDLKKIISFHYGLEVLLLVKTRHTLSLQE